MKAMGRFALVVMSLVAESISMACATTAYVDGNCAEDKNCHSDVQDIPGTVCIDKNCVCPLPGWKVCCALSDTAANCRKACREPAQCAVEREEKDGGGSGGGGSGGGGSDGGGEPAKPEKECDTAEECPPPSIDPRCGGPTCIQGKCGLEITPGPVPAQRRGDCTRMDCDVQGRVVPIDDPSDIYNDGKECTVDICKDGAPVNMIAWQGSKCPETLTGVCYENLCVDCVDVWDTKCPFGLACDGFQCVSEHCVMNDIKDGDETDVNCGGSCKPCIKGGKCFTGNDCISGVCAVLCQSPSCSDGVSNDGETGVDCGAPSCGACADGQGCGTGQDCASGVCWAGKCQAPSCLDGTPNGGETGEDCGGPCGPCL